LFRNNGEALIFAESYSYHGTAIVTPEPSTLVLLGGLGLMVFGYAAARRLFGRWPLGQSAGQSARGFGWVEACFGRGTIESRNGNKEWE